MPVRLPVFGSAAHRLWLGYSVSSKPYLVLCSKTMLILRSVHRQSMFFVVCDSPCPAPRTQSEQIQASMN